MLKYSLKYCPYHVISYGNHFKFNKNMKQMQGTAMSMYSDIRMDMGILFLRRRSRLVARTKNLKLFNQRWGTRFF